MTIFESDPFTWQWFAAIALFCFALFNGWFVSHLCGMTIFDRRNTTVMGVVVNYWVDVWRMRRFVLLFIIFCLHVLPIALLAMSWSLLQLPYVLWGHHSGWRESILIGFLCFVGFAYLGYRCARKEDDRFVQNFQGSLSSFDFDPPQFRR
jgi:hypothetical protein